MADYRRRAGCRSPAAPPFPALGHASVRFPKAISFSPHGRFPERMTRLFSSPECLGGRIPWRVRPTQAHAPDPRLLALFDESAPGPRPHARPAPLPYAHPNPRRAPADPLRTPARPPRFPPFTRPLPRSSIHPERTRRDRFTPHVPRRGAHPLWRAGAVFTSGCTVSHVRTRRAGRAERPREPPRAPSPYSRTVTSAAHPISTFIHQSPSLAPLRTRTVTPLHSKGDG